MWSRTGAFVSWVVRRFSEFFLSFQKDFASSSPIAPARSYDFLKRAVEKSEQIGRVYFNDFTMMSPQKMESFMSRGKFISLFSLADDVDVVVRRDGALK